VVIDADQGITDQDAHIAGYALERGCGCILLLNKWDLVKKGDRKRNDFIEELRYSARFLSCAPVLTISAATGFHVAKAFPLVDEVFRQYTSRVGTGEFNRVLKNAVVRNEPPLHHGKRLKFYYGSQVSAKPPTFAIFVNYADRVHFSYKRYLINQVRTSFALQNTPIRLYFRQRTGRIDFAARKGKRQQRKNPGKLRRLHRKKRGA